MNAALASLALAAATPVLAAEPVPKHAFDFPEIEIAKATSPHEWPFSVEKGDLTCVQLGQVRGVIFSEPWRTDVPQEFGNMTLPRSVIVSANPLAIFASYEDRSLYAPYDSLETLIRRLAPFEAMGTRLCEAGKTDAAP